MKRPLVYFTLIFCLGIFSGRYFQAGFVPAYIACLLFFLLSAFSFRRSVRFNLFFACAGLFLGVSALAASSLVPKCHISNYLFYGRDNIYTIRGVIIDGPRVKDDLTVFPFRVSEVYFNRRGVYACGSIMVYAGTKNKLRYGEELLLTGKITRTGNFLPGMRVESGLFVVRLSKDKGFFLKALALRIKEKIEEKIFRHISNLASAILDAMVLGEKARIPPLVYKAMIKSGTVHILVVSGFNVGIVAFIIALGLKFMRVNRMLRVYIAFALLAFYCLVTGASTPVLRATVMAVVFMSAYLLKREPDIYNSCAVAALIILAVSPQKLFDIGLQLSFASVLAIVFLYPRVRLFLRAEGLKPKCVQFLLDTALVSFCAWAGTLGLVAFYFGIFSPIAVLANLLIVPQAILLTLCGFSFIAVSFICPALAQIFAQPCELLALLLIKTNALLVKLPGAYFRIY